MYNYKFHKLIIDLFRWAIKKAYEQEVGSGTNIKELTEDLKTAWQTLIEENYFEE